MADTTPKEKVVKKKNSWLPVPQPGKYKVQIQTIFSTGTPVSPVSISVTTIPQVADLLYKAGVSLLEERYVKGSTLDIEPADVLFAGEIAIAVAAAKNGNSELSKQIAVLDCHVPEPLYEIADSIGIVTDEFGTSRPLENADELALSHYVAAAASVSKLGIFEEVQELILETKNYVAYPKDKPKLLVPVEYLSNELFAKCASTANRMTSPSLFKKNSDRWTESMVKHKKKKSCEPNFLVYLENMRLRFLAQKETESSAFISNLVYIMLHEKYPRARALAKTTSKDLIYAPAGIIELEHLRRLTDIQIKRCARSIGKLLDEVIPSRKTIGITRKGTLAMLISSGPDGTMTVDHPSEEENQTLAYVAQFKVHPTPIKCKYTPQEEWNTFTNEWIYSYQTENTQLIGDQTSE